MARPVQPLGTYGTITVKKVSPRVYYASTRFRAFDGGYVRLQASGATRQAAEREVKAKAASIVDSVVKGDLTAQATFEDVALLWLEEITGLERLAPQTIDAYEACLRRTIMPALGKLRLRELTVGTLDRYFKALAKDKPGEAKRARVVLSQVMALAVRHDALPINPAKQTAGVRRTRREVRILSSEELAHMRKLIREWRTGDGVMGPRPDDQIAQVFDVILGSSARIGEALAVRLADVDEVASPMTVAISGTVVLVKGRGLIRQDHPKHSKHWRIVTLPAFAEQAVRERIAAMQSRDPEQTLFCSRNGTPLSPANVRRRWRAIRAGTGLPDELDLSAVIPHTLRKTVATTLERHGGIKIAAELLGHSSEAITEEFYVRSTKTVNPMTASILERLGPGHSG